MQLSDHLSAWIPEEQMCRFGEVVLSKGEDSGLYCGRHASDQGTDVSELTLLNCVQEVREMSKFDEEGEYRPLKTAPTLKGGWVIMDSDISEFYLKLDAIYPAALAVTFRYFEGNIEPVPLRNTFKRQTGMYQSAKEITDFQANQIMRDTCAKGCLRQIAWPLDDKCEVSLLPQPKRRIPLICTEACHFAVTQAQRLARKD